MRFKLFVFGFLVLSLFACNSHGESCVRFFDTYENPSISNPIPTLPKIGPVTLPRFPMSKNVPASALIYAGKVTLKNIHPNKIAYVEISSVSDPNLLLVQYFEIKQVNTAKKVFYQTYNMASYVKIENRRGQNNPTIYLGKTIRVPKSGILKYKKPKTQLITQEIGFSFYSTNDTVLTVAGGKVKQLEYKLSGGHQVFDLSNNELNRLSSSLLQ